MRVLGAVPSKSTIPTQSCAEATVCQLCDFEFTRDYQLWRCDVRIAGRAALSHFSVEWFVWERDGSGVVQCFGLGASSAEEPPFLFRPFQLQADTRDAMPGDIKLYRH